MSEKRAFLFLQGVCSPFFSGLADSLLARGHRVFKFHFNAGDWLYWWNKPAWNYRGPSAELAGILEDRYKRFEITDQILFGDCRPIHRPAVERGKALGVRTHVFEEGYFRPFWVTLERGGVNGHSRLPRDPDWYRDKGKRLPNRGEGQSFHSSFAIRAVHDVAYHLSGFYNPLLFPHYRTHSPVNAVVEYIGYLRRLSTLHLHRPRNVALIKDVIRTATPFFFLPLQLGGDAQIRTHSPFKNMAEVLAAVLASFAGHAPAEARLIIKNHPLDAGLDHYPQMLHALTRQYGLINRVDYLETGDLASLLPHARGTVTVNSTVGEQALAAHCPTIVLGHSIYNLPGLTFQGPLDRFWNEVAKPDAELFRCFRNTVIHTTQVNGGFYSRQGIQMTIDNSRHLLEAERSPLEELL